MHTEEEYIEMFQDQIDSINLRLDRLECMSDGESDNGPKCTQVQKYRLTELLTQIDIRLDKFERRFLA